MKKLAILSILILSLFPGTSCNSLPIPAPTPTLPPSMGTGEFEKFYKVTLQEASQIIGLPFPTPSYWPDNYQIQQVYLRDDDKSGWTVVMLISNEQLIEQDGKFNEKMRLTISWFDYDLGLKIPGLQAVPIGDSFGKLLDTKSAIELHWYSSGRLMVLRAQKETSIDELARVANSVVQTPRNLIVAKIQHSENIIIPNVQQGIEPTENIIIHNGQQGAVTLEVASNALKAVDVKTSIAKILPGVTIEILPSSFRLDPNDVREVKAVINVGSDAPQPIWPRWTYPTGPSPSGLGPITETAYYYLSFTVDYSYQAIGQTKLDKTSVSVKLKFREPPPLPPGMIAFGEAARAVKFDFQFQLPRYLPEGVEPPFIGFNLTTDDPRGVIVHYTNFDVQMMPEPGAAGPPANMAGEKITIKGKSGIIGAGRVDWWGYDVHFTVMSDNVPIKEQILIAESMMYTVPAPGGSLLKK